MTKWILILALACNQVLYDKIYRAIILNTIKTAMTHADLEERNKTIETLRALCQGQKSSYEEHR